ncbi:hypothetical protein WA026_017931 [Henosepilachna vigintioctopunctata]|uniref:Pyroglutamyl-peptidase 1 n=1 Tax=Henosepilachna vigintioctopunctata TaxID=420089 RepID=A0AAW1TWK4_9CUCU
MVEFHEFYDKNILVTGFGPFGNHPINASWEAVKLLPDEFLGHKVVKCQIPVSYTDVENKIPQMWSSLKPELVVHVGVSGEARKITIEKNANRNGYVISDCYGKEHPTGQVCEAEVGEDCISTGIDVKEICDFLNNTSEPMKYEQSENAGRYLCEYIYYTSLMQDREKCIFIHVPPLDSPYTAKQLTTALLRIIENVLNRGCICLGK